MKKLLVLFCSAGVLFMAGCGSEKVTPEDVGKQYMEKRFAGADANLTDLAYTVVDAGDDMATVEIKGSITYKEQIFLKKKNGAWAVTDEAPEAAVVVAEATPVEEVDAQHVPEAKPEVDGHEVAAESHAPVETHAAVEEAHTPEETQSAVDAHATADTHAPAKEAAHH
ncbi:hypothetical protein [Desulfoluna limicola]|nr:hypothetical protein [Desulfoluna limicola]